jgi:hypothetical protein
LIGYYGGRRIIRIPGGNMPLNVKNDEAHRLAKELAELKGESITEAVTGALRDAVAKARLRRHASTERLISELTKLHVTALLFRFWIRALPRKSSGMTNKDCLSDGDRHLGYPCHPFT